MHSQWLGEIGKELHAAMKICVINGSPKGSYSITLQTSLYLEKKFPEHELRYLEAGARIRTLGQDPSEAWKLLEWADLLLFSYPVYTFLAPSQLHRFIRLMKESGIDVSGKYATQITTSKHFYDITAHQYIEDNCQDLGLKVIHGLSADMEDLTTEQGQKDAVQFMKYVSWCVENDVHEPEKTAGCRLEGEAAGISGKAETKTENTCQEMSAGNQESQTCTHENMQPGERNASESKSEEENADRKPHAREVVIVADLRSGDTGLEQLIREYEAVCTTPTRLVNLAEYPFQGGCLGCFHCAGDGKCIYKDNFDVFLREQIQTADAIVYAFSIVDHSMGPQFKMYDDRQFCNGHRTVTEGMPFGYLINGHYEEESNLRNVIEARCQVGHNFLAGVGTDKQSICDMSKRLCYAMENQYVPPRNFWGVGGMKIFRDLIWLMRGLMKADHEFYKQHGIYDFPQKQRGKMLVMCLLGAMVRNPKIRAKMGNKMNEGMVAPYRKVIEGATIDR